MKIPVSLPMPWLGDIWYWRGEDLDSIRFRLNEDWDRVVSTIVENVVSDIRRYYDEDAGISIPRPNQEG